jgi:hypothetical protein
MGFIRISELCPRSLILFWYLNYDRSVKYETLCGTSLFKVSSPEICVLLQLKAGIGVNGWTGCKQCMAAP